MGVFASKESWQCKIKLSHELILRIQAPMGLFSSSVFFTCENVNKWNVV